MNVMIAKILIQNFVDDNGEHLNFEPGNWQANAEQIVEVAVDLGETEIIEMVQGIIEMKMAEHMLSFRRG